MSLVCHLLADYLESIDKNYDKARKVYQTTCDDFKYAKSCTKYATYALLGKGTQQKADFPSACSYFDKGCELGDATSCFHQGLLLITQNEKHGISRDVLKVELLFLKRLLFFRHTIDLLLVKPH